MRLIGTVFLIHSGTHKLPQSGPFFFPPLDVGTIVPGKWGGGNVYVVHHFSKSSSLYV